MLSMKRTKRSDGKHGMPSIDRISVLPDAVLCHILSLLPTKLSVATSILARRWRYVWTYVPNLFFKYICIRELDMERLDMINRIMLQYKMRDMNTFHFKLRLPGTRVPSDDALCSLAGRVETWIVTSIEHNVKNIEICFDPGMYDSLKLVFPRCLFTCKTLVDLRLHECTGIPRDGEVCLPNLKILHLHYFRYEADESLPHLLSGCPILEELIVHFMCDDDGLNCLHISSPTLKRLEVIPHYDNLRVVINAPIVRYLKVHSAWISARLSTSLTELDISFDLCDTVDGPYELSVLNTIDSLCNVKCVKLSTDFLQLPDSAFANSNIKFPNINELHLYADWRFISKFLQSSDNLQVLRVCKNFYGRDDEDLQCWVEPQEAPRCLLSHLTSIGIDDFGCTEYDFDLVKYLLRNAKVLKRMEIYSRNIDCERKLEVLQRISLYPRESNACELAFN